MIYWFILVYISMGLIAGMVFAKLFPRDPELIGLYTVIWPISIFAFSILGFGYGIFLVFDKIGKFFQYIMRD
jgi:hypothetical protein